MNSIDFTNRTAVVTGGAQGIGKAVAERLAGGGARVALWDMDVDLARDTATQLGNGAIALAVDVSDWDSVAAAYNSTISQLGRVDVVVNSAGIAGSNAPVADYPVAEFKKVIDINLVGTFHVNRAVVAGMRDQNYGRVVNIASVAGKRAIRTPRPIRRPKRA
jgi:2-dehydro-3-deoxy-L-rhamnonate dehydrogenase (NAD+)